MGTENKRERIRCGPGIESRSPSPGSGSGEKSAKERIKTVFYITEQGRKLAGRIAGRFPHTEILKFNANKIASLWSTSDSMIFIMASGIVVRTIAPLLKDKMTDPAVIVMDERGSFVISLLSGHIGGANALAAEVADSLDAQAVITTASDVQGKLSLDVWASENDLYIDDLGKLKTLSMKIVSGEKIKVYTKLPFLKERVPEEFEIVRKLEDADLIVSSTLLKSKALFLRPRNLVAGIGCNRGTEQGEIEEVFQSVLLEANLSLHSVKKLATIDVKSDEQGILDFSRQRGIPLAFFSNDDLNDAAREFSIESSPAVKAATGAVAVCEPAAILGAMEMGSDITLIKPKEKRGNVTLAIAKAKFMLSE